MQALSSSTHELGNTESREKIERERGLQVLVLCKSIPILVLFCELNSERLLLCFQWM